MIEKCIHETGSNKRYAGGWVVGFYVTSLDYKNKGSEFQREYDNDPLKEIHAFKMQ